MPPPPSLPPSLTSTHSFCYACYSLRMAANYLADGYGPRTIYIRAEDAAPYAELDTIAKKDRRSVSYLIAEAVRFYVSEYWRNESQLAKMEAAEKAKAKAKAATDNA